MRIPGVGEVTAAQVIAAARQLERAMAEGLYLRFELDRRPAEQAELLRALALHDVADKAVGPLRDDIEPLIAALEDLEMKAKRTSSRIRLFFSRRRDRDEARQALLDLNALLDNPSTADLEERLEKAATKLRDAAEPLDPWADYTEHVATYNGLLVDVGGLSPDRAAAEGFIPEELARLVHEHPLNTSLLNVSLRGYQAFGAKFALLQRKAMLGDEMGLGKTIEALAAMCHLQSDGASHFLVVSPASVLVNWLHEVDRHTDLAPTRLHGSEPGAQLQGLVTSRRRRRHDVPVAQLALKPPVRYPGGASGRRRGALRQEPERAPNHRREELHAAR